MTPSQPGPPWNFGLLRHLKSGAFGFRLLSRSSHIFPPQTGHGGSSFVPAGFAVDTAPASRGGQMMPSQPSLLHLKSGAFGFRLPARLSHIWPAHFGQGGDASGAAPSGRSCSVMDES